MAWRMGWVVIVLLAALGCGRGRVERQRAPAENGAQKPGEPGEPGEPVALEGDAATRAALEAIGYVAEGNEAAGASGVTVHQADKVQPGTNLVVSSHGFEVELIDMDGAVLWTWKVPDQEAPRGTRAAAFRRAWLMDDGDVMALVEGSWLMRLDPHGRVVWKSERNHHHDVHFEQDGTMHALARRAVTFPRFREKPALEDQILVFSPQGKVLREVSILKALGRSGNKDALAAARDGGMDVLHINSLELLDGRAAQYNPAFAAGNYLVSSRGLSALMVVEPTEEKVIWIERGVYKRQHDAKILNDGQLMIFDNHNPGPSAVRTFELGGFTETWSYAGGAEGTFFTECCGTATRLDNGNVLIAVSDEGLAVEVTPAGERVWEWHTPYRAPGKADRVARLMDIIRTPPADQLPWLAQARAGG